MIWPDEGLLIAENGDMIDTAVRRYRREGGGLASGERTQGILVGVIVHALKVFLGQAGVRIEFECPIPISLG